MPAQSFIWHLAASTAKAEVAFYTTCHWLAHHASILTLLFALSRKTPLVELHGFMMHWMQWYLCVERRSHVTHSSEA